MMAAMIMSWAHGQQYQLKARHPGYDIWYVGRYPERGYTWHARPKGTPAATHHAESPGELDEALRQAELESL